MFDPSKPNYAAIERRMVEERLMGWFEESVRPKQRRVKRNKKTADEVQTGDSADTFEEPLK